MLSIQDCFDVELELDHSHDSLDITGILDRGNPGCGDEFGSRRLRIDKLSHREYVLSMAKRVV